MPDADQFTPSFVVAFVTNCHAAGLTKEATVDLLTISAIAAAHRQPGFAEGFRERMAREELEKSAWALAGKALVGGLGLAGLGYAGSQAMDAFHNHNREAWSDAPTIGGYDPVAAAKGEQDQLNAASKGIGALNSTVDANGKRRAELQTAIDSGSPGSANAVGELQRLRTDPSSAQRDAYGRQLDSYHQHSADNLATAQKDLQDLNASRHSWWNKARNFVGMPADLDGRERELVGQTSRLAQQARISGRLSDRLRSGTTEFANYDPATQPSLQDRFFPTH